MKGRKKSPWVQGKNERKNSCQGRRWKGKTKKDEEMLLEEERYMKK
jgi:hypothetical protein